VNNTVLTAADSNWAETLFSLLGFSTDPWTVLISFNLEMKTKANYRIGHYVYESIKMYTLSRCIHVTNNLSQKYAHTHVCNLTGFF
jgi:hypothetical protein